MERHESAGVEIGARAHERKGSRIAVAPADAGASDGGLPTARRRLRRSDSVLPDVRQPRGRMGSSSPEMLEFYGLSTIGRVASPLRK
jgi:hypothetical protein